jgi:hypothetical protein
MWRYSLEVSHCARWHRGHLLENRAAAAQGYYSAGRSSDSPISHHVVVAAFGHPGASLPRDRGVLVVEPFVMEANTSNNVLFDLYDLIG